jgi:hypothetical protein
MPLKNPLTPPTTPNDEIQREDDGEFSMFSPEVTEEIALLLYFMVDSYLQASSGIYQYCTLIVYIDIYWIILHSVSETGLCGRGVKAYVAKV